MYLRPSLAAVSIASKAVRSRKVQACTPSRQPSFSAAASSRAGCWVVRGKRRNRAPGSRVRSMVAAVYPPRMSQRFLDLSHAVEHGVVTYKGLPAPVICDFLSRADSRAHYAPGTEFAIGRIDMVANTGTYVDSPFHRYADGKDLAALPLESLAELDAIVVDLPRGARALEAGALAKLDFTGRAVLVRTGWSKRY